MRVISGTTIVLTRLETLILEGDAYQELRPDVIQRLKIKVLRMVRQYQGEKIVIRPTR